VRDANVGNESLWTPSACRPGHRTTRPYPRPVHRRSAGAALTAACAIAVLALTPAAVADTAPTPSATHAVPPAAPSPTSSGRSPEAPDPHPPSGGIGPDGEAVGGSRLLSRLLVVPPHAPKLPDDLTAQAWVLVDLDSGDVLAARDPHGRYQPASILKTLTTITLLPLLPGNRSVTVSSAAANTEGSHAGLIPFGTYTVDQLFRGLLLVSGNDTAAALADAAGGAAHTVDLMNAEAQKLGGYDTFVETPSGLDGWRQLTSAYDMALFLRAAVNEPRFIAYDRALTAELPAQHTKITGLDAVPLTNQNETFLTTVPGALVAKTGFTDAAQHTFVGAVQRHGRRLGVVFLRAQRWPDDQWQQAVNLINWGFALPAGTAPVGHLDAPVAGYAPPSPAISTPAQSKAAEALRPHLALGAKPHDSLRMEIQLMAVAIFVVAVGAMLWRFNRTH
jgi:serine-type D-Ala-D-Ala carboxypeptidase (penicillin-binding protein 5/6)